MVPTVKKSVFAFKTRPVIAANGLQKGIFVGVINETPENGDEFNRVVVTVELETMDGKGNRFVVKKDYNILPNGRGFSAFIEDYNAWSDAGFTENDLYIEHDYDVLFKGKPVIVEVEHRKNGSEWEAVIVAFHPVGTEALAA